MEHHASEQSSVTIHILTNGRHVRLWPEGGAESVWAWPTDFFTPWEDKTRPPITQLLVDSIVLSVMIQVRVSFLQICASNIVFYYILTGTDTWTVVAPLSSKRDAVGVCPLGDRLMAIGGYDGCQYLRTVEQYDPNSNEWTSAAPLITGRAGACVVAVSLQQCAFQS